MKLALVILAVLPLCFAVPVQKRVFLDTFLHQANFKAFVDQMFATLGGDATEAACEQECHVLIKADHLLQFSCPLVCKSMQSLFVRFGHITTTASA